MTTAYWIRFCVLVVLMWALLSFATSLVAKGEGFALDARSRDAAVTGPRPSPEGAAGSRYFPDGLTLRAGRSATNAGSPFRDRTTAREGQIMLEVEPGKVYEIDDVAALLGVGARTVKRYISCGTLKGHRVGRRTFVRSEDLCECLGGPTDSAEAPATGVAALRKSAAPIVQKQARAVEPRRSRKVQVNAYVAIDQAAFIEKLVCDGRDNGAKELTGSSVIRVGIELLRGLEIDWKGIENEQDLCERARSALVAGGPTQLRL
jgi:excisionase family DNA binding protein